MSRRKEQAISADLLDQLLVGTDTVTALHQGGLLDALKKALTALAAFEAGEWSGAISPVPHLYS